MVHYYRKVNCPCCGKIAERTTTTSKTLIGSPFRICPNCGGFYFDQAYREPGIILFESKAGDVFPMGAIAAVAFTFAAGVFIYQAIREGVDGILFPMIFVLIFAIICDVGVIIAIKERAHSDAYHQKQIDRIERRNGEAFDDALQQSMLRLGQREYLDALKAHGVSVPDYFYQRLRD